ncbi:DUF1836 domain-containing protein [Collinsella sp. An2]|uniref:DUF1836 domain-containing protein n=1 Tax=Collinsella sp. An2 TaxID=1965585 RepID=UPI001EF47A30|nr:DUF1836 domain-containing protein [Collinsella sp. An2]
MKTQPSVIPMADDSKRITQEDIAPTLLPDDYLSSDIAHDLCSFHMPRYNELPSVDLYRDQVIAFVSQVFQPLSACIEGDWLTPSMVNNYVKLGLLASPHKRLYGREQVARLVVICLFKQVLSISDIARLFRIQSMTYVSDVAYNYVATELEHALHASFSHRAEAAPDSASMVTRESLLVRNVVNAFVSKLYLLGYLRFIGYDDDSAIHARS